MVWALVFVGTKKIEGFSGRNSYFWSVAFTEQFEGLEKVGFVMIC